MLTGKYLRELLDYDATTGVFIWLVGSPRGGRRIAGKVAGSLSLDGYIEIGIDGRRYKAHRLAWLYEHDVWPQKFIDHANGLRADNRISNLREATQSQNLANARLSRANTSGFKGVHIHGTKYQAMIMSHGKQRHLGLFSTPELAHEAYVAAAIKLRGEFARSR